jgi:inner membrane protein
VTRSPRPSSAASRLFWGRPVQLPWWAPLTAVVVVLAVQPILGRLDIDTQFALVGVVDWIGHLATGLVLVALLTPPLRVAVAIMVCSVVIDVDHLPLELGTDVLTAGTPRPYTHSLLTLVVVLLVAGALRSPVLLGAAIGLAGHFLRDLGTGDGIPLLWPLSDAGASVPFALYVGILTGLAAVAALRAGPGGATPTARRTRVRWRGATRAAARARGWAPAGRGGSGG